MPVGFQTLTPGVFATLGILLRGRDFAQADRSAQATVAVVNEAFVRRLVPARDPIGQRVGFQQWPALEIVGVAGDTRTGDVTSPIDPAIDLPEQTDRSRLAVYFVRAARPAALPAAIRATVARLDADAVVFDVTSMDAPPGADRRLAEATRGGEEGINKEQGRSEDYQVSDNARPQKPTRLPSSPSPVLA